MQNENAVDRIVRLFLGLVLFLAGFFWLGGGWAIVAYALAAVMLLTAAIGFCPLYKVAGTGTLRANSWAPGKLALIGVTVAAIVLLAGGSYASAFFSRKFYLEDFNQMNQFYKQALFQTGQNNRELAVENYNQLVPEYAAFQAKYNSYHPYAFKNDPQFNADLANVAQMIAAVDEQVHSGDLHEAHLALEEVRPVFQGIFQRNGFSMLAVALVDFHDVMEVVLDAANAKDPAAVETAYKTADEKLKAVEAAANDAEIQAIRHNLDSVLNLAQSGQLDALPDQANTLKSSFVKVYLKRG